MRVATSINGYQHYDSIPSDGTYDPTNETLSADLINGLTLNFSVNESVAYNGRNYPTGSSSAFAFDNSRRVTNSTVVTNKFDQTVKANGAPLDIAWTTKKISDRTYDADDHMISNHLVTATTRTDADENVTTTSVGDPGVATLGWGPNGHPIVDGSSSSTTPASTLHWDGDTILFVTDSTGTVVDFKAGLDGEIAPHGPGYQGLNVYERDAAGVILQTVNSSGSSGMTPLDPTDASGPKVSATSGYSNSQQYYPYERSDGFKWGDLQINGVRTFDPAFGSWTTPDAYAGDIHDPMSQKPFMWNRNDPYTYSDPSGYNPLEDIERGFDKWLANVSSPGGERGERSGGLSQRNIEGIKKDQDGISTKDHAQKLRDALNGAMNRLNDALSKGNTSVAQKASEAYNSAVRALERTGADVTKALTGSVGGQGNVKFPEEISPAVRAAPEPLPIPEGIFEI